MNSIESFASLKTTRPELFKDEYYTTSYYKFINKEKTHRGFKYDYGLNIDTQPFNPSGRCLVGGLYFAPLQTVGNWQHFGTELVEVTVPANIPVYHDFYSFEPAKYKAPQIIIKKVDVYSNDFIEKVLNTPNININVFTYDNICEMENAQIVNLYYDAYYNTKSAVNKYKIFEIIKKRNNINDLELDVFNKHNICDIIYSYIKLNKEERETTTVIQDIKTKLMPNIIEKYHNDTNCGAIKLDYSTEKLEKFLNEKVIEGFPNMLKNTGSVISGSLVVKDILGDSFGCNDIDVYCNESQLNKLLDYFPKTFYYKIRKVSNKNMYNLEKITRMYEITIESVNNFIGSSIYYIRAPGKKPVKIQIIGISDEVNPLNFIKDNFDFDFCMCAYDGENKIILCDEGNIATKTGKISDIYINKCFKQTDSYSTYRISKTTDRLIKYTKRGFTIANQDLFLDELAKYNI